MELTNLVGSSLSATHQMETQTLFLTCSSLFFLSLIHFFRTCNANNSYCTPSSCGVISNISFPFRLKDDPKNCGDRRYELACENNVTFVYLNSHKFYVKAINYHNSRIRVVDASINNGICSFPTISAYHYNFSGEFLLTNYYTNSYLDRSLPINFMSCPNPLKNSSLFINITHDCASSNSSHPSRYTYIKVDHLYASNLTQGCRLEMIVLTSWEFKDLNNVSLSEIHLSLLYGFELRFCDECQVYPPSTWDHFANFFVNRLTSHVLFLLVIVVLLSAVISPPVMVIIGFAAVLGLSLHVALSTYLYTTVDRRNAAINIIPSLIMICAPRFIICPLVVWLLIHKFRTRRLSSFEGIESFLQSDNKLAPIRYSYSDLKKMTRGFRDKLGEGGYGSVFKGKLRSGHHVAVKLLGKSGGNGQDFINEIATIGRIHHVNVVQLIGYCAQGSKRALVFDFMPNGSLEKYLFTREKVSSLNLNVKFDIAVGIARGIEYLHRGCDVQILHFDIKPHNILLDDKFVPKISDFGLAKFFSTEKNTVTMTAARGTIGYVAPELINRSIGAVSYKADVYSFGMLLMEMVSLKKDLMRNHGDSSQYFPFWIYDHINQGKDIEIGKDDENNDDMRRVGRKMTIVALWCIQMNPDDRPSMSKVLEMLEGDVERLLIPDYPSQLTQNDVNADHSLITYSTSSLPLQHYDDVSSCLEIRVQK